ncbi:ArnT family glycosyltransferase [Singulisphaera rosea]
MSVSRPSPDLETEIRPAPAGRPLRLLVVGLIVVHAGLLVLPLRMNFITVDEAMNVVAGVSYWTTGRFTIYRVNPPLPKLLAVLPTLAAHPRLDFSHLRDDPAVREEFQAGREFIEANRHRIFDLVCLSRLAGVGWSVLGGWLVYRWARSLHGESGALMALGLWCFEPYILGHAALVTSDIPAAVAGLLASYAFWIFLKRPSWRWALVAGLALGVAELTKFTLLVFYPAWPFLWWFGRMLPTVGPRPTVGQFLLIVALSLNVINLGYTCQGTGERLGDYPFISHLLSGTTDHSIGNRFRGTWPGTFPVPLPSDFLRGIDVQRVDFENTRLSYMAGSWSSHGWWYFYLYALAVKLPLGTLILLIWGLAKVFLRRPSESLPLENLALLVPSAAILIFVSTQTGYTLHSRYVVPALPYLMICAGRIVAGVQSRARWLAWGLLTASIASSLSVYPSSLSYFNEAAGGPTRGPRHLVDSNIDWGQDLLRLRDWLGAHPEASPLRLAYYNFDLDPGLAGIAFELPPPGPGTSPASPTEVGPRPGYYAVSVNFLQGTSFPIADGRGGFRQTFPHEFEYFRHFRPIARAGYSINIYRITPVEADEARRSLNHSIVP